MKYYYHYTFVPRNERSLISYYIAEAKDEFRNLVLLLVYVAVFTSNSVSSSQKLMKI